MNPKFYETGSHKCFKGNWEQEINTNFAIDAFMPALTKIV